ncbi:MAG: hypothetical protein RR637_09030 [Clostridium sp.]|uniref:hypothetical protein n=1 Tax=Clostridium sp. TaxID=1506 RepID=UPI002FCA513B
MDRQLFLPLYDCSEYIERYKNRGIFCTRFSKDFQSKCFLYSASESNSITYDRASELNKSIDLCYVYDMFHFENMEFTVEGFSEINKDIQSIINCGFKYIMVSNPFIIEILCNEYSDKINVVISSQLEINSSQSKIFFDVLNNTESISHIVISQNYICEEDFNSILQVFSDKKIVVEVDRLYSKNQIIHEHYYNMLYGYYNQNVECNISKFIEESRKYIEKTKKSMLESKIIQYKIGEINVDRKCVEYNIEKLNQELYDDIIICDYSMWTERV